MKASLYYYRRERSYTSIAAFVISLYFLFPVNYLPMSYVQGFAHYCHPIDTVSTLGPPFVLNSPWVQSAPPCRLCSDQRLYLTDDWCRLWNALWAHRISPIFIQHFSWSELYTEAPCYKFGLTVTRACQDHLHIYVTLSTADRDHWSRSKVPPSIQ